MALNFGTKAWIGLAAYIAVVEILAPKGETLSERVDLWIERHPGKAVWHAGVFIVGAHLLNLLPQRFDPIHQLFVKLSQP